MSALQGVREMSTGSHPPTCPPSGPSAYPARNVVSPAPKGGGLRVGGERGFPTRAFLWKDVEEGVPKGMGRSQGHDLQPLCSAGAVGQHTLFPGSDPPPLPPIHLQSCLEKHTDNFLIIFGRLFFGK